MPFGIFGSIIAGIGMIVGGAVSGYFAIGIVGVAVMVCGIGITIACVIARALKNAKLDNSSFEKEIGNALRNSYRDARTGFENAEGSEGSDGEADEEYDENGDEDDEEYDENGDEDEIPLEELVEKINKRGNTASDVCDRDDALTDLLYRADREDLADRYYDTVNEVWNCISGDEYSEYTAFINGAIDTFYKIYCDEIDENSAISRLNDEKTALFAEKFDEPTAEPEPENDDGENEEIDENITKVACDGTDETYESDPENSGDISPENAVIEPTKTDTQAVGESASNTVTPHETIENSHAERHVEPKEHSSAGRVGAARINYKPIKKK